MPERASVFVTAVAVAVAGCGRIDFDPVPHTFGYLIDYDNPTQPTGPDAIAIVELDLATGALVERPAFDLGARPTWVIGGARGTALYASCRESTSIFTLHIDALTGALTVAGQVASASWPFALALHPSGRFLYAAAEGKPQVWGYAIADDDTLAPIAGSPWTYNGLSSDFIAIDPSGAWLYAVDDDTEKLYGFAVAADGSLTEQPSLVWATGDDDPHAAVFDGTGRFGFIAPDNATAGGPIPGFTLDVATGTLSTTPGSPFASGADTSEHAAVSAAGDVLFLTFEGGCCFLNAYGIAGDGSLAHLPHSPLPVPSLALGVAAAPVGDLALVATSDGVAVVTASAASDVSLVTAQPLVGLASTWHVALVRTP